MLWHFGSRRIDRCWMLAIIVWNMLPALRENPKVHAPLALWSSYETISHWQRFSKRARMTYQHHDIHMVTRLATWSRTARESLKIHAEGSPLIPQVAGVLSSHPMLFHTTNKWDKLFHLHGIWRALLWLTVWMNTLLRYNLFKLGVEKWGTMEKRKGAVAENIPTSGKKEITYSPYLVLLRSGALHRS